jgi:hypothetical protein
MKAALTEDDECELFQEGEGREGRRSEILEQFREVMRGMCL